MWFDLAFNVVKFEINSNFFSQEEFFFASRILRFFTLRFDFLLFDLRFFFKFFLIFFLT